MQVSHNNQNGTVTGTTTSAYVEALSISGDTGYVGKAIFKITNLTGATATMYYKLDGYIAAHPSCVATAITAETDVVNATPVVNNTTATPYAKLVLSVKTHSAACAYQVDYIVY